MVNFAIHQVRAGSTGAREDFEQMIGLLVRAISGRDARLVLAPYDWGIDVLVGDLRSSVEIWQAKYFTGVVSRSRIDMIRASFHAALRAASDHGYTMERWVLCVPSDLDGPATQWWHKWKAQQEHQTGVAIEVWDQTLLRELLLTPQAADIYRHYYAPSEARGAGRAEPGQPMINFAAHLVRAGSVGASDDFKQMIELLVRVVSGQDGPLSCGPAKWGVDAVADGANGVTVWQAKYFAQGIRRSHQDQIAAAFTAAVKAATDHGSALERWVLCIPSSMDGPTMQWWHNWKAEQEHRNGVTLDLWDECVLRELLLRPEAAEIYFRYYAPSLQSRSDSGQLVEPASRERYFTRRGHVFISYVREDSGQVDMLQRAFELTGLPVWRDTANLWPGEDWKGKIREAITNNSLVFIACFSSRSIARQKSYQNEELLLAVDQLRSRQPDDPWLIPVRLDDCDVPNMDLGAGRTLASIHRADLFGPGRDSATTRLVGAVQRLLLK